MRRFTAASLIAALVLMTLLVSSCDPPRETVSQTDSGELVIVYVTNTGTKYHRNGCFYLASSEKAMVLGDAIKQGYKPCSKCKPPK